MERSKLRYACIVGRLDWLYKMDRKESIQEYYKSQKFIKPCSFFVRYKKIISDTSAEFARGNSGYYKLVEWNMAHSHPLSMHISQPGKYR